MRADLNCSRKLVVVAAIAFAASGPALSFSHDEFCRAMREIARVRNADAGRWLDRNTRDDGVELLCEIRTVNFKRFLTRLSTLQPGWERRKQDEWNSTHCSSVLWREAIDNGWNITATITTAAGERRLIVAQCK